ncbi:exonuclease domain-containing protein [Peribacillus butanolivorans]|uniref:exonuclease domain-containing protein n=1 Tax=Peribacillus butanolivorans TaxID=421767 RepID=UPI0036B2F80F
MKNFIAFDFETANSNRHSICSVGMVFVEDRKIVDSVYQLIDPEEPFDEFNIGIHGISPKDVKDAPTFDVFYETIKEKIENKLMIAHYLAFDGYALRDNLERYDVEPCFNQFLCTYQLSKKLMLGQLSYSLKTLCQHFEIDLIRHHNALDDAKACADLMLSLMDEYELVDLNSIYLKTFIRPGEISKEKYRSSLVSKGSKLDLRTVEVAADANTNNAFYGKNVVFTGKLNVFTRIEAAQLVASRGGHPQNGLNKQTNFIILGNFEDVMIKGTKSSKLEKAEKMISAGKELEILAEEDFLKML